MTEFHLQIVFLFEIIGTVAFAASGAIVAIRKELDLFGVLVLGAMTAVGGGILRDVIIGRIPPVTFVHPVYLLTAFATAALLFLIFYRFPTLDESRPFGFSERILNILDAVGLGTFTVLGVNAGVEAGYGKYAFLLVFLGVVTGVGGGILRDIMAGEIPFVLKKQIYACASLAGAVLYVFLLRYARDLSDSALLLSAALVVLIRFLAGYFRWDLPAVRRK